MPMKNPVLPGRSVRLDCLEPLGLSVTKTAQILGGTRQALNNVSNEKAAISPEMAIRLSKAFGSTPETWVRMQAAFDLAVALKRAKDIRVDRYQPYPQRRNATVSEPPIPPPPRPPTRGIEPLAGAEPTPFQTLAIELSKTHPPANSSHRSKK
jgi:addiction module HigA family antidote